MLHQLSPRRSALLALLLLAAIWGYNWVMMKLGVRYAAPFDFAAIRALFGALSLFLVMIGLRKSLKPKAIPGLMLLGGLQTSGMIGFMTWALVSGGAGKTSVLVYTMPFWILIFAWFVLGERLRSLQWLAVAIALAGLLLILFPLDTTDGFSKGLAIAAGMCWGMGAVVTKVLRQRVSLDLLSLTAWQMLFGSVPLTIAAIVTPSAPIQWTPTFIVAVLYNILLGTALAYVLWLFAVSHLPAGTAGLATLANPVLGVLAAWLQLGEQPEAIELLGMVLIIAALSLNTLQAIQPVPHPSVPK